MRVFSRVGLVGLFSTLATPIAATALGQPPPAPVGPLPGVSPAPAPPPAPPPARAVAWLADVTSPFVAVHLLPAGDAGARSAWVQAFVARAPEAAGVTHVFLSPTPTADLRAWVATADPARLVEDSDGAVAAAILGSPDPSARVVILDRDRREIARLIANPPTFDAFVASLLAASRSPAVAQYNLPKPDAPAVDGYDVVAYQTTGKPTKGSPTIASVFRGVTYRFSSQSHRDTFARDPERYVPTYGGWCASAMGDKGTRVSIDPRNFKVKDGRLFLFYKSFLADALKDWNKREGEWEPAADTNWQKQTGEPPGPRTTK